MYNILCPNTTSDGSFASYEKLVTLVPEPKTSESVTSADDTITLDSSIPLATLKPKRGSSSYDGEEEKEAATPKTRRRTSLDEVDRQMLLHMKRARDNEKNPKRMFLLSLLPLLENVPPEELIETQMRLLNVSTVLK